MYLSAAPGCQFGLCGRTGALDAAGLTPGDRVLLVAPSVPEFVVAYMGIQAAGCVVVPVNTMSTRPELEYVLADAGCSLAIVWHRVDRSGDRHEAGRCKGQTQAPTTTGTILAVVVTVRP